ncbi:MAG: PadR family transcriptional regulator [Vicinamibacterales bacterium]
MGTDSALIKGTLDLLILKVVSLEPMHGWGIAQRIQAMSGDTLLVQQGSLYAALHRLTREGWITSAWRDTDLGRRARFYHLTPAGARQLDEEIGHWTRLSAGVSRIVNA